jgi:hypothetical protein
MGEGPSRYKGQRNGGLFGEESDDERNNHLKVYKNPKECPKTT